MHLRASGEEFAHRLQGLEILPPTVERDEGMTALTELDGIELDGVRSHCLSHYAHFYLFISLN